MLHVEQHGPVTAIRMSRSLLGRPVYWTAAYWVDGLLIDSGPPCTAQELVRSLANRPVEQVVVTHAHEDHIGGLAHIQRAFPHARLLAPRGAIAAIAEPERLHLQPYRQILWGRPRPTQGLRSLDEVDDRITTAAYSFRVVETPGHTAHHVSLFEPTQRWLFSGDAYIGGEDRAWPGSYDLFGTISSLRTLASLRPQRLFSGSGRVRRTPLPDIHAKIGYYTRLAEQTARLQSTGASMDEIAHELLGGESRMRFWTGGHFTAANLIRACQEYNALLQPASYVEIDVTGEHPSDEAEDLFGPPSSRSTDLTL